MKDLEICKRIAAIESHTVDCEFRDFIVVKNGGDGKAFSPLKDKALCFDLMVKHRISFEEVYSIETGESEGFIATWLDGEYYKESHDKNPQRAICLAIIKKFESKV